MTTTTIMYGLTGLLNDINAKYEFHRASHDAHIHTFKNCISYFYSTDIGVIDEHLLDQLQYSGDVEVYQSFRVNMNLVPYGICPEDELDMYISHLSDKPDWLI